MVWNFSVTDVLLLLGIGQGFFLSITLPILTNKNSAANQILILQLLLSGFILLARMALHDAEELWIVQRLAPLESIIFIFGPLGYIYLKRLLQKGQKRFKLPWFHYLPALLYLVYLLYLGTYSNEEFGQKLIQGYFSDGFFIAELAAILFNLYYWFLGILFFLKIIKKEKEQYSFEQSAIFFVRVLLVTSGVVLFAWTASFISVHIFNVFLPVINYNFVWITIPILIYIVGFFALKQPEIVRVMVTEKPKGRVRELLNEQGITLLKQKLTKLMKDEKVYLNNELSLVNLSKQLNTSTNNLSWLLNTVYNSNFYDFVNEYRIKAFVSKLEQEEHKMKTLFSLSMEVGFNSKSTFNKAFKSVLNETPSSYIKKLAG
nr:helix-turn-helix domain-containing protein [uncultured Allomuricauda sp.]